MDIGKSIRIALANINKSRAWLAREMGVTRGYISNMANGRTIPGGKMIESLAGIFGMTTSEFIALGETEEKHDAHV